MLPGIFQTQRENPEGEFQKSDEERPSRDHVKADLWRRLYRRPQRLSQLPTATETFGFNCKNSLRVALKNHETDFVTLVDENVSRKEAEWQVGETGNI